MDARKCYVTVLLAGLLLAIFVAETEAKRGGAVARTSSRSLGSLQSRRNSRDGNSRRRGHNLHSEDEINMMAGSLVTHDVKKNGEVKKTAPGESNPSTLKKIDSNKKLQAERTETEDIPQVPVSVGEASQSVKSRSPAGDRNVPESGQDKYANIKESGGIPAGV